MERVVQRGRRNVKNRTGPKEECIKRLGGRQQHGSDDKGKAVNGGEGRVGHAHERGRARARARAKEREREREREREPTTTSTSSSCHKPVGAANTQNRYTQQWADVHLVHEPRQQPRLNPAKPLVPADLVERVGGISVGRLVGLLRLPLADVAAAAAAAKHQLALQLHAGLHHLHLVWCTREKCETKELFFSSSGYICKGDGCISHYCDEDTLCFALVAEFSSCVRLTSARAQQECLPT